MLRPEMPYLAAGAISVVGGAVKEKAFPANGVLSITATIFLVIVVSMSTGTKIAPLLHAIGMLLVLGAVYGTVMKITPTHGTLAAPTK